MLAEIEGQEQIISEIFCMFFLSQSKQQLPKDVAMNKLYIRLSNAS